MQPTPLFNLSWSRYLNLLFLLFSASFFTSGIVMLIAANLDYWSDLQKIYGMQALLVGSVALSAYFFWRESRKLPKEKLKLLSTTLFFVTAVLIGALFALVGQTYQTGADPWELFALWSVCQIPLLLLLPNVASALLLVVTSNLALNGYFLSWDSQKFIYLVLLNGVFLLLSELFIRHLHDSRWRILPKVLLPLTLFYLFGVTPFANSGFFLFLQVGVISAAAFYFYRRYRFDFMNLVVATLAALIALSFWLLSLVNFSDTSILVGALIFGLTIWASYRLYQIYKAQYPERRSISWIFSLLLIFAIIIGIATVIAFWVVILHLDSFEWIFSISAVLTLGSGLLLHASSRESYSKNAFIIGIFWLIGFGCVAGFLCFVQYGEYVRIYNRGFPLYIPVVYTAIVAGFYWIRQEFWLRTLILLSVLTMWNFYFHQLTFFSSFTSEEKEFINYFFYFLFILIITCLGAFFAQKIYKDRPRLA